MEKVAATQKLLSYLGLAQKAGKAVCGSQNAEAAIKNMQARLVLLAGDTGKNSVKHFSDMASYRNIPCFMLDDNGKMGEAIGRGEKKTVCITDAGFAAAIIKEINLFGGRQ